MFITFEGLDFSGKTTQAKMLHSYFKKKGKKSILIREPGGTKISERIREILLDKKHLEMIPLTEFLLFSASRAQLVEQVIRPNLKRNVIVICDRYYDSSTAYQGYAGKLSLRKINEVSEFATGGLKPEVTFLINIPPVTALERQKIRGKLLDRIENKKRAFYNKVYRGFLEIAKQNRNRFVILDGRQSVANLHKEIIKHFTQSTQRKSPRPQRRT